MPIENWNRMPSPKQIQAMALTRDEAKRKIADKGDTLVEHVLLLLITHPSADVRGHWAGEIAAILNACGAWATNLKKSKDLDATAVTGFLMSSHNSRPQRAGRMVKFHLGEHPTRVVRSLETALADLHGVVYQLSALALEREYQNEPVTRSDVLNLIP